MEEKIEEKEVFKDGETLAEELYDASVVIEEVGSIEAQSVDSIKKSGYYVVFTAKEHGAKEVGDSIKDVHIARFESKRDLKKVVSALDSNGLKLIDIIKGRPLSFRIESRTISEIKIGD